MINIDKKKYNMYYLVFVIVYSILSIVNISNKINGTSFIFGVIIILESIFCVGFIKYFIDNIRNKENKFGKIFLIITLVVSLLADIFELIMNFNFVCKYDYELINEFINMFFIIIKLFLVIIIYLSLKNQNEKYSKFFIFGIIIVSLLFIIKCINVNNYNFQRYIEEIYYLGNNNILKTCFYIFLCIYFYYYNKGITSKTKTVTIISTVLIIIAISSIFLINDFIPMLINKNNAENNINIFKEINNIQESTNVAERYFKVGNKKIYYKYYKNYNDYYINNWHVYQYNDLIINVGAGSEAYAKKDEILKLDYFIYNNKKYYIEVSDKNIQIYCFIDNYCYIMGISKIFNNNKLDLQNTDLSIIKAFLDIEVI